MADVPILLLASTDPVLREVAAGTLACDLPGALMIGYEFCSESELLRRRVHTTETRIEDRQVPMTSCCLTCSVRADLVETIARVAAHRPAALIISLPVTMDPAPIAFGLFDDALDLGVRVAACAAVLSADRLERDLFGADLLADRHLALSEEDRRAVGEALVRQVEIADVIALSGDAGPRTQAILDHLAGSEPARFPLHGIDLSTMLGRRWVPEKARRGDLRVAAATGAADAAGVWTLDLQSWKPMHPQRLLRGLKRLGAGPVRGRGYFWLPTRPQVRCAWDGAGGQLSVGVLERWRSPASTRLVITGTDRRPQRVRAAFEAALMTDAELGSSLDRWREPGADGWENWLGPRAEDAFTGERIGE